MKKISLFFAFVLVLALPFPQIAHANMADPKKSDIASSITFEKNESISVLSEVLDITVDGVEADIAATYKMKNTTNENIYTQSMFLSPNVGDSGVKVVVGGKEASFTVESYALNYGTEVKTTDWQYAVLTDNDIENGNEYETVDAITFDMNFAPNEEYEVIVSYRYRLGGYPEYETGVKYGKIEYYLAPAAMWKDFAGLTINLTLDKDMPIIKRSNLAFEKVSTRTYQYVSESLPEENLEIVIDENRYQNIKSSIKSPYLLMILMIFSPLILIGLVIIAFIIWRVRKRKKETRKNQRL